MKPALFAFLLASPAGAATQYMLIGYGQSLALGHYGCGAISTTQPYTGPGNQMILNGAGSSLIPLTDNGSEIGGNTCSGVNAWSSSVSYLVGAVVTNGGNTYQATTANTNQAPPNTAYWTQVPNYEETPLTSAANNLTMLSNGTLFVIANTFGLGGTAISGLWRGTGPYSQMISGVTAVNNLVKAAGNTLVVLGVVFTEGEQDFINGSNTYYADSMTIQSQIQADIQAISGQTAAIPFFFSQLSSEMGGSIPSGLVPTCPDGLQACIGDPTGAAALTNSDKVSIAQWRLAHDYPNLFYLSGPKYQYPYGEAALHLSNRGYNMLGAAIARALKCVFVDHGTNCVGGVYPKTIYISGNVITLTASTPNNLALTTAVNSSQDILPLPVPYRNGASDSIGMGFQVFQTTGGAQSSIGITSVSVSGPTVTITLASTPTGTNLRLAYAFEGQRYSLSPTLNCSPTATSCNGNTLGGTLGSQGALHGNIRTVADYTDLNGDPVYHWMVHFNEPILTQSIQPAPAVKSGGVCSGCRF
ncbi:MAG: hypothetical protein JOZ22_20355 [Acidobacteriia bacterium]|nr:hypothetical protein [Terriglobia bacterium]